MNMSAPSHITIDEHGVARIDESRLKVIHLIEAWKAGASTPEKLREAYPHLTLAQVYAALAYYYDHQKAIDDEIGRTLKEFEAARAAAPESPLRKKLRDAGLRP